MNSFAPLCYKCLKPLKMIGLNPNGFPKYSKCYCKKSNLNKKETKK